MTGRYLLEGFTSYGGYRFLKLAIVIVCAALALFVFGPNEGVPHGGTVQGYVLGGIAGAILLFLVWFGVRRRRYATTMVPLRAWTSAHIYLGMVLIPIALLHSDGSISFSFHGLFFFLVVGAVVTGFYGLVLYVRNPSLIASNRSGMQLDAVISEISGIDEDLRSISRNLPDEVNEHVRRAEAATAISNHRGGALNTTSTASSRAKAAIDQLDMTAYSNEFQLSTRKALSLLVRKDSLVRRARREVRLRTQLKTWLFLHVPLAIASVIGLAIHVFSVFFYW